MRCLAIDIGGTKIASALVENNQLSDRLQIRTPQAEGAQAMHQALAELVAHYQGQFDAISVASTGIINQGVLTALNPKNLGGLAEFPLKESFARHTDKPIFLLNDVQAAACAEYQHEDKALVQKFCLYYGFHWRRWWHYSTRKNCCVNLVELQDISGIP